MSFCLMPGVVHILRNSFFIHYLLAAGISDAVSYWLKLQHWAPTHDNSDYCTQAHYTSVSIRRSSLYGNVIHSKLLPLNIQNILLHALLYLLIPLLFIILSLTLCFCLIFDLTLASTLSLYFKSKNLKNNK